ncbi:MAG: hypothetical protein WBP26_04695 [Candidatus Saccharimonadales bacterium]
MKQKDIAVIIVVIFVAAAASFFLSKMLFGPQVKEEEVEKVESISIEFPYPSKLYFNKDSLNPAQHVEVTNNNNTNPFGN